MDENQHIRNKPEGESRGMTVMESQTTTTDGDTISGEMTIKFTNVKVDDFLKYRGRVREIIGLGHIGLTHTMIVENSISVEAKALVEQRKEDMGLPPTTPADAPIAKVAKPRPPKRPYLSMESRQLLQTCTGLTNTEVLKRYRARFKNTKFFDAEIIQMFNRVQGIK
jgi:hypothetical protein